MLRYILEVVGDDRICLGSDYPFLLGDLEIGNFIEKMGLSQDALERIFYKNTLHWLYGEK